MASYAENVSISLRHHEVCRLHGHLLSHIFWEIREYELFICIDCPIISTVYILADVNPKLNWGSDVNPLEYIQEPFEASY